MSVFAVALALSACAAQTPVSPITAPPALGLADPPNAIQYTAWAFAVPSRTHGQTGTAARSVAALFYLASALNNDPVYKYLSPIADVEILRATSDTRRILGIAPTATLQQVVNGLTAVYANLARGDRAGAEFPHIHAWASAYIGDTEQSPIYP